MRKKPAGSHFQPLWIIEGAIGDLPQINGVSLGVAPDVHYEKKEILLSPGESVILFTDGIIEAQNKNNELFGNDRLVDAIKDLSGPPWGEELLGLVRHWQGNSPAIDDLTILEIWRDKNSI